MFKCPDYTNIRVYINILVMLTCPDYDLSFEYF